MIAGDESTAYNSLSHWFKMECVNHSVEYMGINGENTNQAESFFSRFRRMQFGQMHNFGNLYLNPYANEAAYREDTRRRSNSEIFKDIMTRFAQFEVSHHFCVFWQGNKNMAETLICSVFSDSRKSSIEILNLESSLTIQLLLLLLLLLLLFLFLE